MLPALISSIALSIPSPHLADLPHGLDAAPGAGISNCRTDLAEIVELHEGVKKGHLPARYRVNSLRMKLSGTGPS